MGILLGWCQDSDNYNDFNSLFIAHNCHLLISPCSCFHYKEMNSNTIYMFKFTSQPACAFLGNTCLFLQEMYLNMSKNSVHQFKPALYMQMFQLPHFSSTIVIFGPVNDCCFAKWLKFGPYGKAGQMDLENLGKIMKFAECCFDYFF